MAEPTTRLDPPPIREPVVDRSVLVLTATWVRYVTESQRRLEARLAAIEARLTALEGP